MLDENVTLTLGYVERAWGGGILKYAKQNFGHMTSIFLNYINTRKSTYTNLYHSFRNNSF